MRNKRLNGILNAGIIFLFVSASYAQGDGSDIYWRIDPSVKSCSMVMDPSLTQAQWNKFTKQVGAILTFKSLASAETLGKMNFNITIDDSYTPVDQHDLAWINTFTHPDEDCPLGDAITYPTLRARMGVSGNMDIGAYWTTAPGGNYGMMGGEFKYKFLQESEKLPAAAVRASVSILTGVPDYNLNTYGVDLMASKKIAMLIPYIGFRESLAIGTETTSKVNLDKESLLITQGYAGVSYSIWMLNLVAEYNVSYVNTFALAIGFNF
jgi:hypothetical protein